MRTILAGASLVLTAACTDRAGITSPLVNDTETTASPAALAASADLGAAIDDALTRVMAGIETDGRTTESIALASALRGASETVTDGARLSSSALESLTRTLDAMEGAAQGNPGALAELGAVRRIVDRAATLAQASASQSR